MRMNLSLQNYLKNRGLLFLQYKDKSKIISPFNLSRSLPLIIASEKSFRVTTNFVQLLL